MRRIIVSRCVRDMLASTTWPHTAAVSVYPSAGTRGPPAWALPPRRPLRTGAGSSTRAWSGAPTSKRKRGSSREPSVKSEAAWWEGDRGTGSMPELAEVEAVRRILNDFLVGRRIVKTDIDTTSDTSIFKRNGHAGLSRAFRTFPYVVGVSRWGKNLWLVLSSVVGRGAIRRQQDLQVMHVHLGMTGHWKLKEKELAPYAEVALKTVKSTANKLPPAGAVARAAEAARLARAMRQQQQTGHEPRVRLPTTGDDGEGSAFSFEYDGDANGTAAGKNTKSAPRGKQVKTAKGKGGAATARKRKLMAEEAEGESDAESAFSFESAKEGKKGTKGGSDEPPAKRAKKGWGKEEGEQKEEHALEADADPWPPRFAKITFTLEEVLEPVSGVRGSGGRKAVPSLPMRTHVAFCDSRKFAEVSLLDPGCADDFVALEPAQDKKARAIAGATSAGDEWHVHSEQLLSRVKTRCELAADPLLHMCTRDEFVALCRGTVRYDMGFCDVTGKMMGRYAQAKRRLGGSVKAALLDQRKLCCGIGNWLADDILYEAGIHPESEVPALSDADLTRLHAAIQTIVRISSNETNADHTRFPKHWLFHLRWRSRKKDEQYDDSRPSIVSATVAGRTSVFCTKAQVLRRVGDASDPVDKAKKPVGKKVTAKKAAAKKPGAKGAKKTKTGGGNEDEDASSSSSGDATAAKKKKKPAKKPAGKRGGRRSR